MNHNLYNVKYKPIINHNIKININCSKQIKLDEFQAIVKINLAQADITIVIFCGEIILCPQKSSRTFLFFCLMFQKKQISVWSHIMQTFYNQLTV